MRRLTFLASVASFGLGLGLCTTIQSAHACSYILPYLDVELLQVEGDGDLAAEQAYWPQSANIQDYGERLGWATETTSFDLEEVDG